MTVKEKRCEDCACLISKNGKMCCDELWGKPCNEVDECPEGIELEEVQELQEKASKIKIDHGASGEKAKTERKIVKKEASDAKKFLFSNILGQLEEVFGENVKVLTENKLITVQIDDKTFKIDVIEQRKPKK